jgi:hypothetical protein
LGKDPRLKDKLGVGFCGGPLGPILGISDERPRNGAVGNEARAERLWFHHCFWRASTGSGISRSTEECQRPFPHATDDSFRIATLEWRVGSSRLAHSQARLSFRRNAAEPGQAEEAVVQFHRHRLPDGSAVKCARPDLEFFIAPAWPPRRDSKVVCSPRLPHGDGLLDDRGPHCIPRKPSSRPFSNSRTASSIRAKLEQA